MKNIVFLLIAAFSLGACNSQTETKSNAVKSAENEVIESEGKAIKEVLSPKDFKEKMNNIEDYYLIDVRTAQELVEIPAIEGAVNIDIYGNDFIENLKSLDSQKAVFVYCRSGARSAQAAQQLEQLGFKEIYDLAGGITAWKTNIK